jgi:hypothetical protein
MYVDDKTESKQSRIAVRVGGWGMVRVSDKYNIHPPTPTNNNIIEKNLTGFLWSKVRVSGCDPLQMSNRSISDFTIVEAHISISRFYSSVIFEKFRCLMYNMIGPI